LSGALAVLGAGLEVKILAADRKSGVPGLVTDTWGVLDTLEVKTVSDLRGKTISINALGTAVDLALQVMMKQHGMVDKPDYQIVQVVFPRVDEMKRLVTLTW
jgi:ABC-type nitrate/sulfonate/bicarbonate transport system substrate-binding protein